jgi:hypothetical protein
MTWLFPTFLAGAFAAALPLVLHFLRRKSSQPIPFPALRFLVATREADRRRHRLRRWLVLAMRCLAFGLLAAAFARPFFKEKSGAGSRATIVVIDNSFSLQTGGRWTQLLAWTRNELGKPEAGETVGLLLMNPRPSWLVAPTRDFAAVLRALGSYQPGWQATQVLPALRFAGDVLAESPAASRRIVFLGDHQASGWADADFSRPLPAGVTVRFPEVANAPARQASLASPTVTREGEKLVVRAIVQNFSGPHQRTLRLFLGSDTNAAATVEVALGAKERKVVEISAPLPPGESVAWIRCALDADDLPADDVAYAIVPGKTGERLVLLDRPAEVAGADYVATAYHALAALPPTLRVAALPNAAWPNGGVAVLRNDASFSGESAARLDAFLAAGGSALIFLNGGPAQAKWLAARRAAPQLLTESARLRDWAVDHPLVTPLAEHGLRSLVGWSFERGWALPGEAVEPLAFWSDGRPALGELAAGGERVLVAGFSADRRDGNWPVEGAFVPFLHRAVTYLLGASSRAPESAPRVGASLKLPSSGGTWQALAGPAASEPARGIGDRVTPVAPGIYAWSAPGAPQRLFAVGLSAEESDLAPWSEGTPWVRLISAEKPSPRSAPERRNLAATEAEQRSGLWWWCFAVAVFLLLSELALANRTVR